MRNESVDEYPLVWIFREGVGVFLGPRFGERVRVDLSDMTGNDIQLLVRT